MCSNDPPPCPRNGLTCVTFYYFFFSEWALYLDHHSSLPPDVIITEDFNFHIDDKDDWNTRRFGRLLEANGLVQHGSNPTHIKHHAIGVIRPESCRVLNT